MLYSCTHIATVDEPLNLPDLKLVEYVRERQTTCYIIPTVTEAIEFVIKHSKTS